MTYRCVRTIVTAFLCLVVSGRASADDNAVELTARSGTPLRVALDKTVTLTRVGQPVSATLIEPLYIYDRVVLPAGARVTGHVASLESASRLTRFRAWSNGKFTPMRHATVVFDSAEREGEPIALQALAVNALVNVERQVAGGRQTPRATTSDPPKDEGKIARAEQELRHQASQAIASAKQQAHDAIGTITQPGRMDRLKRAAIEQLPYHPQYLTKGTVFDAELQDTVTFGRVEPAAMADAGTLPPPSSTLRARLTTTLDSSKATRGTRFEAVVAEPVFSNDHRLIVPAGTRLGGEVTVARPARSFHRNGQLRFLFDTVHLPASEPVTLLASLRAVDVSADDHVAVDEEGGARTTDSKKRFIAPALAVLALAGAGDDHHHVADHDADDAGFAAGTVRQGGGNLGSRSLGGFFSLGLIGIGVARVSQPVGVVMAAAGVARTTYANILGKGRDVRFAADTPIDLQLAPGPSPSR